MRTWLLPLSAACLLTIAGAGYGLASSGATDSAPGSAPGAAAGHQSTCHGHHHSCPPTSVSSTASSTAASSAAHKLMVIVEENHSRLEAIAGMPHLAAWASTYGQATHYSAITHPSLPNYLAIGGGSTFGVTDDSGPSAHPISGASVFGQTVAAGKTAKTYAESMPANCDRSDSGQYAVKHNEWAYFSAASERAACQAGDVPMGSTTSGNLLNDINAGRLPITGQMTPNLCHDAHDCSLATADTWLAHWVAKLIAGPDYTGGRLTIAITFDEDDGSATNNVAFVVIDPRLHARTVTTAANHYSLTRWLEHNAAVPLLRNAATAADLQTAFGL